MVERSLLSSLDVNSSSNYFKAWGADVIGSNPISPISSINKVVQLELLI